MRKILLLALGLLLSLLFILPGRYVYVCKIMGNCGTALVRGVVDRPMNLQLRNGERVLLDGYEHFSFAPGTLQPNLTTNNQEFLDKLAAHLKAHPEQHLTITGYFRPSERGTSAGMFENLGVARADALRNLLVQRGIDVGRISLDHALSADEDLRQPATFNLFVPRPDDYADEDNLAKTQFRFDNMTFSDANFEFDSDAFKPGPAFLTWADSVITFFEGNQEKSLTIVGHTDNLGTITYNQDLGLRRAQSARQFFVDQGVETAIETETRGEKQPVATNQTDEGRQKNRRVNFIID